MQTITITTEYSHYDGHIEPNGDVHIQSRSSNDYPEFQTREYEGFVRGGLAVVNRQLDLPASETGLIVERTDSADFDGETFNVTWVTGVTIEGEAGSPIREEFEAVANLVMELGGSIGFEGISQSEGMKSVEAIILDLARAIERGEATLARPVLPA